MSERGPFISPQLATELLRDHLNPLITVTDVRKLYGGSVNRVLEFILDREPGSVVVKIHDTSVKGFFQAEVDSLRFYKFRTHFPVPDLLAWIEDDERYDGTMLVLQKINGITLEAARLSERGKAVFQHELGAAISELHNHQTEKFGPVSGGKPYDTWLDVFGPIATKIVEENRGLLPSSSREVIDHIARHLDHWLDHKPKPTLIHGDLWANNIMISDAHPDQPRILSFIDSHATFADPEYELAYLQLFGTGGKTFFNTYAKKHPLSSGFERRAKVYWMFTLLQNAQRYGERYIPQCERLALELRKLSK
ncbi:MAG: fructosamine kinase family protein [Phycisphaeraceae bacterium]